MSKRNVFDTPGSSFSATPLLECTVMEEVVLNSDILIHYFGQGLGEDTQRHEQAVAVMEQVYAGELTAHISDIGLVQVAKFLMEVDVSNLAAELYEQRREYFLQHGSADYEKVRMVRYLRPLIELPNVIIPNKVQWRVTLDMLFLGSMLSLETAYNIAAAELMEREEQLKIQGIVTFEELYAATERVGIPHIDPAEFQ